MQPKLATFDEFFPFKSDSKTGDAGIERGGIKSCPGQGEGTDILTWGMYGFYTGSRRLDLGIPCVFDMRRLRNLHAPNP